MENNTSISFFAAEVKEVVYTDTEANTIYGVRVRAMGDPGPTNNIDDATVQTAIPLNYNFVRVPIVGEVVLCLRAPSAYQTGTRSQQNLYYLDVVSLQSSVHHNGIPTVTDVKAAPNTSNSDGYEQSSAGNTNKQQPPSIDPNFTEILNPAVLNLFTISKSNDSIKPTPVIPAAFNSATVYNICTLAPAYAPLKGVIVRFEIPPTPKV